MLDHKPRPPIQRFLRETYFFVRNPLAQLYWNVFKPHGLGIKCFVFNGEKILLLKIGYAHRGWVLPGGAVDRGEQPLEAAIRELYEEAGIRIEDMEQIATGIRFKGSGKVTLHYFLGYTHTEDIVVDDQEIVDAGWFSLDELPANRRRILDEEIALYKNWKHGRNA